MINSITAHQQQCKTELKLTHDPLDMLKHVHKMLINVHICATMHNFYVHYLGQTKVDRCRF